MITKLLLHNFRIHSNYICDVGDAKWVLISGENGSGKTSLIEAISFIAPGKGLRSASFVDAIKLGENQWSSFLELVKNDDVYEIGMSCSKKRIIKIDGKFIRSSTSLLEHARVIWLTPSEDHIINGSKLIRRKMLDRLTYNFIPSHLEAILKYNHLLKSRMKLIRQNHCDEVWLGRIEALISETSILISSNRYAAITRLNQWLSLDHNDIVKPSIKIHCPTSDDIANIHLAEEKMLEIASRLKKSRNLDASLGRSLYGVHRCDFNILNFNKNIAAYKSSTGELKMMLISIIIAQIHSLNHHNNIKPILLLDDIFAHIDDMYSCAIIRKLASIDAQIWVTGTDFSHTIRNAIYEKNVSISIY